MRQCRRRGPLLGCGEHHADAVVLIGIGIGIGIGFGAAFIAA